MSLGFYDYLCFAVVGISVILVLLCLVAFVFSVLASRRPATQVAVKKKVVSAQKSQKNVTAYAASFDTQTFIRCYLDRHPDFKRELKEELINE